jgi:hypothetical protein
MTYNCVYYFDELREKLYSLFIGQLAGHFARSREDDTGADVQTFVRASAILIN